MYGETLRGAEVEMKQETPVEASALNMLLRLKPASSHEG